MTDELSQPNNQPVGDTGTAPGQKAGQTPTERMIAESQVNHIVTTRLAEKEKEVEARVKSQFADFDKFKSDAEKWSEYQKSQMTEMEKLQTATDAERATWNTERTTLTEQVNKAKESTIELAFLKRAVREGGLTLERAEAAFKLVDRSKLEFDDRGDVKNAAAVVEGLVKDYPFLKPAEMPQPPPAKPGAKISPTNPSGTSDTKGTLAWHRVNRTSDNSFQGGGVRAPDGDKK